MRLLALALAAILLLVFFGPALLDAAAGHPPFVMTLGQISLVALIALAIGWIIGALSFAEGTP